MSSCFFPSYYKLKTASKWPTHASSTATNSRHYFCVECDREYLSASSLYRHFSGIHYSTNSYNIQEVNSPSVSSPGEPNQSIATSSVPCRPESPKGKTCPLCSISLGRSSFTRHMISEHDTEPFLCTACGIRFPDYKKLLTHKISHTDSKSQKKAPDTTSIPGDSSESCRSEQKSTSNKGNGLKCDYCPRKFLRITHMFSHTYSHSSIGFAKSANHSLYKCDFCNSKFTSHGNCGSHLSKHRDLLKCKSCGKQCFFLEDLNQHTTRCGRDRPVLNSDDCDENVIKESESLHLSTDDIHKHGQVNDVSSQTP